MCKLSGMVTEADFNAWTVEDLRPYAETVLEAFGPERLIFGSDWPVCTVAASYAQWAGTVRELIGSLSEREQEMVLGANAVKTYGLSRQRSLREVTGA
jgi:L-fuconolactonase